MFAHSDDSITALFGGFWTGALVIAGAGAALYLSAAVPRWIGDSPLAIVAGAALTCACGGLGLGALAILGRTAPGLPPRPRPDRVCRGSRAGDRRGRRLRIR